MLILQVNGINLDLGDIKGISFRRNGGVFDFEEIKGAQSIPFTLPFSDINNFAFGFLNKKFDKSSNSFECSIFHSTLDLFTGRIFVKNIGSAYECNIKMNSSTFAFDSKDLTMQDVNYGGDIPFTKKTDYDPDVDGFHIPVVRNDITVNAGSGEEGTVDVSLYMNYCLTYTENLYNDINDPVFVWHSGVNITPFPYLFKVIESLFNHLGYTILNHIFKSDTDLKKILLINNYDIAKAVFDSNWSIINYTYDTYNLKNHVPYVSIHDFLLDEKKYFGIHYNFKGNNVVEIQFIEDILNATDYIAMDEYVLDSETIELITEAFDEVEIGCECDREDDAFNAESMYDFSISDINHFPKDSAEARANATPNTLSYLCKDYAVPALYYREEVYLSKLKLVVPSYTIDFIPQTMLNTQKYRSFFKEYTPADVLAKIDNSKRIFSVVSNADAISNLGIDMLGWQLHNDSPRTYNIVHPITSFEMRTSLDPKSNIFTKIRHFFYQGKKTVQDINQYQYPFEVNIHWGYADFCDANERIAGANLRLRHVHEISIYNYPGHEGEYFLPEEYKNSTIINRFYKTFIKWKLSQNHFVARSAKLSITQLRDFDFSKKYIIDGQLYFVLNDEFTLERNGVSEVKWRLVSAPA